MSRAAFAAHGVQGEGVASGMCRLGLRKARALCSRFFHGFADIK